MIHVCSLSRVPETVAATGARRLVTLINAGTPVTRPPAIASENHLFLGMNDIVEVIDGMIPPGEAHVTRLLDFVTAWDRAEPIVIHCWAGISRSTAGAFITACALAPHRDEHEIARSLRRRSSKATPNLRLVTIADGLLGRDGRMTAAIRAIGRGELAFENDPFALPIDADGE